MEKKKGFKMPSAFTVLLLIIIVLGLVTQFIGGGVTPAKFSDVMMSVPLGLADAIDVSFFVMLLGGFLGVVTKTGALDAGVAALVKKLKGKEIMMIPVLMFAFSLGGTSYGMAEETIGFYPLVVATMMAAGFDALTGCSVILIGAALGCMGSTINPFAVCAGIDAVVSTMGDGFAINQTITMSIGALIWISSYAVSYTHLH